MASLVFIEEQPENGVDQPGGAGFSRTSGKAGGVYALTQGSSGTITLQDWQNAIAQAVGYTVYGVSDGRLQRVPPMAYPMAPTLFCTNLASVLGRGLPINYEADSSLDVPTLPNYNLYPTYRYKLEFEDLGYPIFTDANITLNPGSWYNDSGTFQTYVYATEFERYTDVDFIPCTSQDNNLTQQGGQIGNYTLQSTDMTVNGKVFPATQQIQLPNQIFQMVHMDIPYRWFTSANSYYRRWLNRVNQNPITIQGYSFSAGSLLFLGAKPTKHTPPVWNLVQFGNTGIQGSQKNCNMELTFLYTERTGTALPTPPTNGNLIMANHNLLPDFNSKNYYYWTTAKGMPPYLSAPLELLGSDPDAAGGLSL